jgi:methyl-accepting chemotaxis protein
MKQFMEQIPDSLIESARLDQMDKVVQESAAGAEESASASEELSSQAQVLRQTVDQLAVLVGGHTTGTSSSISSNIRKVEPVSAQKAQPKSHLRTKACNQDASNHVGKF